MRKLVSACTRALLVGAACAGVACGDGGGTIGDGSDPGIDGGDSWQDGGSPSPDGSTPARDGGSPGSDAGGSRDGASAGDDGGASGASRIAHVVVVVQENHTFDAYFGAYCTAPAGSSPSCTTGPSCCEAAPAKDPSGAKPVSLDDTANAGYDPNHTQACELSEMNGGAMDRYVTGASCSNAKNFAVAPPSAVQTYHDYASRYALADRYFQPLVGASSSNDMYFAVAKHVFTDNAYKPDSNGQGCIEPGTPTAKYQGQKTLADVLTSGGRTFAFYAEGYKAMLSTPFCPIPPADCPAHVPTTPCDYDPSDNPFEYYAQLTDVATYEKDWQDFSAAIGAGKLPDVSFIKPLQYHNEHPGYGTTISAGTTFVKSVVDLVQGSAYANDTLVLVTWDEGGGFFDHVKPPADSAVDQQPYGTRVPLLAIGRFAKKNAISHVTLEHSSVVRFLEWNFLGTMGQLGARDAVVTSLGSLLDPAEVGTVVPD